MNNPLSIAVVGIGGVFPGSCDADKFWDNIVNSRCMSKNVPPGRWAVDPDKVYNPNIGTVDKVYSKKACFVDNFDLDYSGLSVSPDFLEKLDPVNHLLLYAGLKAYKDADLYKADHSRIGVVAGNLALPTDKSSSLAMEILGRTFEEKVLNSSKTFITGKTDPANRYVTALPAGILASALNLGAGSSTLDAACASSLYAVKLAIDELVLNRADVMLCGGVSRPDSLYTQMGFSQLRALSPTGIPRPFDAKGDGLVVGEGAGIFVLKRLEDAIENDDHIYAVIRAVGLSNDVEGKLLAPSSEGQLRAMRSAYKQAGWIPQDIDIVECHATGIAMGDAVEFRSLRSLWESQGNYNNGQCVIGSVKSNIGHLLTAAGAGALFKIIMALKNKCLPPSANINQPPDELNIEQSPFRILKKSEKWDRRDSNTPRKAAISAFGFGGINAHVLLEEWTDQESYEPVKIKSPKSQPIAVVGMDAYFGKWDSLKKFQYRILGKEEDVSKTSGNFFSVDQSNWFNEMYFKAGSITQGYLINELKIPVGRFRIPPKELQQMLPQQLLMLKTAVDAWHDAGLTDSDNVNSGVFIGLGLDLNTTNFHVRWAIEEYAVKWARYLGRDLSDEQLQKWIQKLRDSFHPPLTANRTMGALGSIAASRIARELRIGGPSFAISSEENSGISAVKTAMDFLNDKQVDSALAGAVDLAGDIRSILTTHEITNYSPTGNCRPFDQNADGTIVGEGAGAVVLKRLSDAQRDGDRIYSVIRSIGNSSGNASLLAGGFDVKKYKESITKACKSQNVSIDRISYHETHGSGNHLQDKLEAEALNDLYTAPDPEEILENQSCAIGSLKGNIGSAGAASSMAGLIKTSLCLYHKIIPKINNSRNIISKFASPKNRFYFPKSPRFWLNNRGSGPRSSAVTSISSDGNYFSVILEEVNPESVAIQENSLSFKSRQYSPIGPSNEALFVVSSDSLDGLFHKMNQLRLLAEKSLHEHENSIENIAVKWHNTPSRDNDQYLTVTFVSRNPAELIDQLVYAQNEIRNNPDAPLDNAVNILPSYAKDRIFYKPEPIKKLKQDAKIAFIFPGSGNQYLDMGRSLFVQWPDILRNQNRENKYLRSQMQPDCFWNMDKWDEETIQQINQNHKAMILGQVALGTAVSDLIRSFGINPNAVIGYSLGETAGLFSMKAWTDRDEMLRRIHESTLFTRDLAGEFEAARKVWKLSKRENVDWVLGVIDQPIKTIQTAIKNRKKVYALIANTLHECVVGGTRTAVENLVDGLKCQFIPIDGVTLAHCEVVKAVEEPYRNLHIFETTPPQDVDFYSGARGRSYKVTSDSAADAILAHALKGVDYPKTILNAYKSGVRFFIEIGPGASCTRMISKILEDKLHFVRSVCYAGQNEVSLVLRTLGNLIAEGVDVDLDTLYGRKAESNNDGDLQRSDPVVIIIGGQDFDVPSVDEFCSEPVEEEIDIDQYQEDYEQSINALGHEKTLTVEDAEAVVFENHDAVNVSSSFVTPEILTNLQDGLDAAAKAHETFLQISNEISESLSKGIAFQMSLLNQIKNQHPDLNFNVQPAQVSKSNTKARSVSSGNELLTYDQCMEFATGSISKVFGPQFAEADSFPTRVRLPDQPLMLVDRVTLLQGNAASMQPGRIITEHDVKQDGWYLDNGYMPVCVTVESGQADLMLSGYLGIDLQTRGLAMYRLLDAEVTFHRNLPTPGQTIQYDIRIEKFFRHNDTWFFHFNFESTVNGKPLLTMKNGCAGFFTNQALEAGQGLVDPKVSLANNTNAKQADFKPLVKVGIESYTENQIDSLRKGDLAACFGHEFANLPFDNPLTIPGGLLRLVHRVVELDPDGGKAESGTIRAEADIHPDDWFLTCHFVDDKVMPGTLMYECCMHTLRILLMRFGWVGPADTVSFQPIKGVTSRLKCRGQVLESTRTVTYEVDILEIGYDPEPFVIAEARMYADGKYIVKIENMSAKLDGIDEDTLRKYWSSNKEKNAIALKPPVYDHDRILAFAIGKPSEAFGDKYKIFDSERKIARLPGPPYEFIDRISDVMGNPWEMKSGSAAEAQYTVPHDAWYFRENRQENMPFAVLLEIALQPCGWLAAYVGSALTSDQDLSFRNLGGKATQYLPVTPETGLLQTNVILTNVSSSGGMIIQHYDMKIRSVLGTVYEGTTYFGFFSKDALANQVGIQDADRYTLPDDAGPEKFQYPRSAPFPDRMMRMVDTIDIYSSEAGNKNLGFIRATKAVDPDEWFFKAHFYQDPVNPGSLGLEAFIQLLKVAAMKRWPVTKQTTFQSVALGQKHEWIYRGQVIPADKMVTVEAEITKIDDTQKMVTADGFLIVDGRVIYQMKDFTLKMD